MSTRKQAGRANRKQQRQEEERRRDRRMRLIFWGTGAAFVILIALAVIFQPKAKGMEVDYAKLPRLGQADAPVKIVEFGDFKCPSCKVFSDTIEPRIKQEYVDTGKAAFYFANFTIINGSMPAALGGQAAYHQGNELFWSYYKAIYKNQKDEQLDWATPDTLVAIAKQENVGLDYDKLKADIMNETYAGDIRTHNGWAQQGNFTGTPTLLINGQKFTEVFDYNKIKQAIDNALGAAK